MKMIPVYLLSCLLTFSSCGEKPNKDTADTKIEKPIVITRQDIKIEKKLLYDQYTLADVYPYKDTTRVFQWDKIRNYLFLLDSMQVSSNTAWGSLQNYKNKQGVPPLVKNSKKNEYNHITDTLGIERNQAAAMYIPTDTTKLARYGRDGGLIRLIKDNSQSANYIKIGAVHIPGEWYVPKKYVKILSDTISFKKAIFVDRTNQNITTLEKVDSVWLIRSMNPATTGLYKPPYKYSTPPGVFLVQGKTKRMNFLRDGSTEKGGYAPFASRFSGGAYIHGVPIDLPRTQTVEFSRTLGTTPRSHMCVRNATSHAEFVYNWATTERTVVFIFD